MKFFLIPALFGAGIGYLIDSSLEGAIVGALILGGITLALAIWGAVILRREAANTIAQDARRRAGR